MSEGEISSINKTWPFSNRSLACKYKADQSHLSLAFCTLVFSSLSLKSAELCCSVFFGFFFVVTRLSLPCFLLSKFSHKGLEVYQWCSKIFLSCWSSEPFGPWIANTLQAAEVSAHALCGANGAICRFPFLGGSLPPLLWVALCTYSHLRGLPYKFCFCLNFKGRCHHNSVTPFWGNMNYLQLVAFGWVSKH